MTAGPSAAPVRLQDMKAYPLGQSFESRPRRQRTSLIVLHESVTYTREAAVSVLLCRGLGVHYTVDRDGSVQQHAPLSRYCYHAGAGRNVTSVGVEIINRYYGDHAVAGEDVIDAVWAHKGRYILPTEAQIAAVWDLVHELGGELGIGDYPSGTGDTFRWGRDPRVTRAFRGVTAHHRWAHADGLVPEHYCWLRARGLEHAEAWAETLAAASSGQRVTTTEASS